MIQEPQPANLQKVWLITGSSSGLGQRLVNSAVKRGDFVISTSRSPRPPTDFNQSPRLVYRQLDVDSSTEEIKKRVGDCITIWGRIDVLVNSAGVMLPGLLEEGGSALLRRQLQTDLFGMLNVTNAVLPHMRERRAGTLVICSSQSSWRTDVPGLGFYATSKIAVRTLGEGLAVELEPFNIKVLITEAGAFGTEGMLTTPFFKENPMPAYDALRADWEHTLASQSGTQKGDPGKAAEIMVDAVRGEGWAEGREWLTKSCEPGWPMYLPLGPDAEVAIRRKCEQMLETCDELGSVIRSTDFEEE